MRTLFKKNLDKSGKMFRYKYLDDNFSDILDKILDFSKKNKLIELPFKQQVYHWYNNIKEKQKCYCGKMTKFKNSTIGYYKYCSKKCMDSSEKTKEKRKKTCLEKFGTNTPSENSKIKNKIIETNNKNYGTNSPLQNIDIKNKSIETLQKNYNVDSPLKSEVIKNKMIKTNLLKYNVENVSQLKEVQEKRKKTMLELYDVEYAMQNDEIKNKMLKNQRKTLLSKYLEYYNEYNVIDIDFENKEYTMICDKNHKFKISYILLNSRRKTNTKICTVCNPINKSISGLEIELLDFIKENYNNTILKSDRKILNGKELDIYLSDINLAFEFNGLYWHSELNKDKYYHYEKTEKCEKKDIQLIHIYEDDWVYKNDIIKSMILNKLNKSSKIYARKTQIREITDNNLIREFLDKNHIQGFVGASIKLGLYYEDELISLMTFGKNRLGIGKLQKYDFELLRFCNKLNYTVIGGASKLFKYFLKTYNPIKIVSYADRSYSNGNLYSKLEFKYSHKSKIGYHYIIDKMRKHRFNYRKSILVKEGYDKNKSAHEIMNDRQLYRIYNSGHKCYIWSSI